MQISKRPWYQGMANFWLNDVGCASYFVAAILAAFLSLITASIENINALIIMFSTICIYSSIAWQSIKMQATEWQFLVVGYREHVMFQGKVFILLSNFISILSIIIANNIHLLATLSLANIIGIIIWFLNRSHSHLFTFVCYCSFFIAALVDILIEQLPIWLIPVNIVLLIATYFFQNKFITAPYSWHSGSLINYLNGLQSGWSPVPSSLFSNYGGSINKGLFPLSYFVGPGLSQHLVLLILFCIIGVVINLFYNIAEHVLFVLTLGLFTIVTLSLWSKIQKKNSWELLLTLPIFNSSDNAKVALSYSIFKLSLLVATLCFVTTFALNFTNQSLSILNVLSYSLACTGGVLFSFAIGNIFKNINFLSLFLCLAFGLNIGLTTYLLENGTNLTTLIILGIYTVAMATMNRFTVRYL
ncbi:hypothetical protein ACN9JF_03835 [Pseudoalteromonas lipolytica]|uniref:hypothetical protein n=1 Tax=Pseudoalteromonas lipolytica TaxID=570156 RepID=UPI003B9DF24A